jgi:hypothetical protein
VPPKRTARHPSGNSKKPDRKPAAAFIKRHADAATGDWTGPSRGLTHPRGGACCRP